MGAGRSSRSACFNKQRAMPKGREGANITAKAEIKVKANAMRGKARGGKARQGKIETKHEEKQKQNA